MRTLSIGARRWLPSRRLARRSRGVLLGGVWLRCVTWWRAYELDRQLASGADPMGSDELSLRVGQLGSARTRVRLGRALRTAVERADRQPEPLGMPPSLIRYASVRATRELLLALAARACGAGPPGVEGLAMISMLLRDGRSPLHHEAASRSLTATALEALDALERGHRTASGPDS